MIVKNKNDTKVQALIPNYRSKLIPINIIVDSKRNLNLPRGSNNQELEKGKTHNIVEIIEYIPNSVVIKRIIKKTTGNISAVSFDSGEALSEKTSPFDTFIQIIDGEAVVVIDRKAHKLSVGESIIIPAHTRNIIEA